jgi:putative hydrolases of HD superfamily
VPEQTHQRVARLTHQIDFLLEIDRLKQVVRRTHILGGGRRENTAEHSWHLALFAIVLAEWADEEIDLQRVVELCLVHDLVEIDAGDTFAYDVAGNADKLERERVAAERIFGMLPADQCLRFRELWDEYERADTPESRFANAVDRLQPVLLNHATGERSPWVEHRVTRDQIVERNLPIADGSRALWEFALARIDEATSRASPSG